jgi:hypothetical protein
MFALGYANFSLTTAQAATLKRSFKIKYLAACSLRSTLAEERVNKVNVVNVVYMWKSATFTTYPHETKGPVNVVNVARGFFG